LVFVALTFFTVGAIIAALSNNFTLMLVGRSLQGVGAGGIISLTEVIITDMVPLRERGKWFGFVLLPQLVRVWMLIQFSFVSGMWAIGSVVSAILEVFLFSSDVSGVLCSCSSPAIF
jgi:MFS family permease